MRHRVVIGSAVALLGALGVVAGLVQESIWLLAGGTLFFTFGLWLSAGEMTASQAAPRSAAPVRATTQPAETPPAAGTRVHLPAPDSPVHAPAADSPVPAPAAGSPVHAHTPGPAGDELLQVGEAVALEDADPSSDPCATVRVPPSLDADVVLAALLEGASDAGSVAAHLWLADESSGTLRLVAAVGAMQPSSRPLALDDEGVLSHACANGSAEFGHIADIKSGGRSVSLWRYAVPLAAGDARGVAAVDLQSTSGRPDVSAFPAITAQLRASLAGALGLRVARAELETAQALIDSVRDLSRILDPDGVLDSTLARALDISGGQTGSVMLLDPATGRLSIARSKGLPEDVVRETSLAEGEGIAGWVLTSGQSALIEDVASRPGVGQRHGVRSAVSVLIADDDGVLGVLNVGSKSYPGRLTASHCAALETLGRQAATALRNARAVAESRELYFDTLKALAVALETKDPFSAGGAERVLECAEAIGAVVGLSEEESRSLRIAALVHDIGMVAAGEGVLSSERALTTVERALLRLHPKIAADMLSETPALRDVIPIVYHHHEWYDGAGYVAGLAGERIPLGARILAVADAYVSMTSARPYRTSRTSKDALSEILEKAGTQFDPRVVDALVEVVGGESGRVPESAEFD